MAQRWTPPNGAKQLCPAVRLVRAHDGPTYAGAISIRTDLGAADASAADADAAALAAVRLNLQPAHALDAATNAGFTYGSGLNREHLPTGRTAAAYAN